MEFLGYKITRKSVGVDNQAGRRRKASGEYHELRQKYQTYEDMRTLRLAVDDANNTENYNRHLLHNIYRKAMADPEVSSQWDTRVLKTLDKEFHITRFDTSKPDTAAMELFKAPWFHMWVKSILEQHLWGFSLIEYGIWDESENCFKAYMDVTGRYHDPIEVVDRDYVKPEFGKIVPQFGDGKEKGYSYLSKRASERLLFVGTPKKEDTILYKVAGYQLLKDNAHKNWSEWAEVYATDFRVGKTMASGTERKDFINMLRDMGSNGYAVIDDEDEIAYIGVNRQDAYMVYQAFLEYCDSKIAQVIFGQSVVMNNTGRVVGKVGEDISNMYGDSDAKAVEWVINTELIPYMSMLGAELDGAKFRYDTTEKLKLGDRAKVDKMIADMGYKVAAEYLERTYGIKLEEYIGVPYSGREGEGGEGEE